MSNIERDRQSKSKAFPVRILHRESLCVTDCDRPLLWEKIAYYEQNCLAIETPAKPKILCLGPEYQMWSISSTIMAYKLLHSKDYRKDKNICLIL